jgi:hypothetical protein
MSDKEAQSVIGLGRSSVTTLDPLQKDVLTRAAIDSAMREAKNHLLRKRKVHLIVVKE